MTRKEDGDDIVANKPRGCVVFIDEAYIHFATSATSAIEHVAAEEKIMKKGVGILCRTGQGLSTNARVDKGS